MNTNLHIFHPLREHTHTVIFLHGRDSTAAEFAAEFFESQASDNRTLPEIFPNFKWVFPTSKLRISARFETEMSQWFDMWSVEEPEERKGLQLNGLRESITFMLDVIHSEVSLVPLGRIILGGISQGCATAISALLCSGIRLGGFIGLCSWLPFQEEIEDVAGRRTAAADTIREILNIFKLASCSEYVATLDTIIGHTPPALVTPVFLSHSRDDEIVLIRNGERLNLVLEHLGMSVTWKVYKDGGH